MTEEELIANGWRRMPVVRYSAALGPSFSRLADGKPIAGLIAQEHLGNDNLGVVHGGAIMTFADMALGMIVAFTNSYVPNFVTAQLSVQLVSSASIGDFITCQPELVRKTTSLAFVRGLIMVGDKTVASADGIFKFLDPAKFKAFGAS